MSEPADGTEEQLRSEARTAGLLDELAAIEEQLDPTPVKRGQRLADLLLVAVVAVLTLVLDVEIRYPLLFMALLFGARGLNRLVPFLRNRSLHADRERLLDPEQPDPENVESPRPP